MRSIESSREAEKSDPQRRWLSIPKSRAMVCDILHFEREVPTFPHSREFNLNSISEAREKASSRISWTVLFIKAFSLVAKEAPILRQAWIQYPWPRLFQSPYSVGYLPVKRTHENEEWLCFAPFFEPENRTLEELGDLLSSYRNEPIPEVFRTQYKSASLPTPIRRLIIASWFRFLGHRRMKRMGTFGITTISSRGAEIQHPPGIHTSTLTYGPIDDSGRCKVTMHYDHRLMDGWYVAEVLQQLEDTLNGAIREELETLQS